MATLPITFLSDYGTEDEFAGVCRAVIAEIAPDARVIDLTHGIPRHSVAQGAEVLARTLPYAPVGVHLAVVDPGVGTTRRAVAVQVRSGGRFLVGPDNGLLWRAIERFDGAAGAVDVSRSSVALTPTSATFHGRDVFAPVAAHLALGAKIGELGEELAVDSLVGLPRPRAVVEAGRMVAEVVAVDGYGNVALAATERDLARLGLDRGGRVAVESPAGERTARVSVTFADAPAGELIVYPDSNRGLALAVNRGSAAKELGLGPGESVALRP